MSDLIERLRQDYCSCTEGYTSRGMIDPHCESCSTKDERHEAADEIERLRRELAEARGAIEIAARALHGDGMADQGEAFDTAARILDAFLVRTEPKP